MQGDDPNHDRAIELAEAGLAVFPCDQGKKPLIKWRNYSSSDPEAVELWWHQYPGALPAIDLEKCDLIVLDGDRHGGPDGRAVLRDLLQQQKDFDPHATPIAITPRDGAHVYFAQNGQALGNARGELPAGIDVRGCGGYVIAPYAVLADGRRYRAVTGTPDLMAAFRADTLPHIPQGIVELIQARKHGNGQAQPNGGCGPAGAREKAFAQAALERCAAELAATARGGRNEALNALAYRLGRMVARGWLDRAAVEGALHGAMHINGYVADKGSKAVEATLRSGLDAGMAEPHEDLRDREEAQPATTTAEATGPPPQRSLADVHRIFRSWFGDEYDLDAATAAIAAVASERLSGDPLWLLIVAGPGGAKTETVQAMMGAGAHVTSTIASEGALLSATPRRERNKKATGGLLRKLGDRGVLVIKDVTSILSADRNTRISVLAAIREIYDGRWERNVGTDGGQTLTWIGRIVIIGAVTTAWDAAHAVVATMGDRFVLLRPKTKAGRKQASEGAIRNTGSESTMRKELAAAVGGLIAHMDTTEHPLSEAEVSQLSNAADIVTMARSAVERDYRGNILFAHDPEMPTRFAKQLVQLLRGAVAIGMTPAQGMRLALRCARDSIPPMRREILIDLGQHPGSLAAEVRERISQPRSTVRRELECLHMLGLLCCDESEEQDANGKTYTIQRYRLAESFDAATLRAMGDDPPAEGRL